MGNTNSLTSLIYTPLPVARRELWRRWNDASLQRLVRDYSRDTLPDVFQVSPKAVLARSIATPNMELLHFLNLTRDMDLDPLVIEYNEDMFTAKNPEKYFLGKMFFYEGEGKNGGRKLKARRIIDFNICQNKMLVEIKTLWNESLVDFHHRLISKQLPGGRFKMVDMSRWVAANGKKASIFYGNYLAFFIRNAILFENFLLKHDEMNFTKNIILPAIRKVESELGLRPLIVPLCPFANESDHYWMFYPPEVETLINSVWMPERKLLKRESTMHLLLDKNGIFSAG